MHIIRLLHVLCIFMWVGNLLCLTRLMGYHVKETADVQERLAKIYKRMYNMISLPMMILTIIFGFILITGLDPKSNMGWFHMKITFALLGLVSCDLVCGSFIRNLNEKPDLSKGIKYKILHGITGLCLIGVLLSVFIVKDRVTNVESHTLTELNQGSQ